MRFEELKMNAIDKLDVMVAENLHKDGIHSH